MAYVGTKGWYVQELKKLGIRSYQGRYIEQYKTFVLANLYDEKKAKSK